jgi:hypothetical protein
MDHYLLLARINGSTNDTQTGNLTRRYFHFPGSNIFKGLLPGRLFGRKSQSYFLLHYI